MNSYIFTSKRLGFRNWKTSDIDLLHLINTDEDVMEFFPSMPSKENTISFVRRMQNQFLEKKYCYFAVEIIKTKQFIGFIGLSEQNFEANFTPCNDIGWRLNKSSWQNGYATEGAKECLKYGFEILNLQQIYSVAPLLNKKSQRVMKKIGMKKLDTFLHPKISNDSELKKCVIYKLEK